jgi:NAD(P)-dependent dehydrogenase (short-subunit alcohol dehydrogenase family)
MQDSKTLIITGANGMLGSFLASSLSERGWNIIGVDLEKTATGEMSDHAYHACDVSDEDDIRRLYEALQATPMTQTVSLVNCAGISIFSDFESRAKAEFMNVLDINLFGSFQMINLYTKLRRNVGFAGSIVNTASIFGFRSPDFRNYVDLDRKNSEVYGASKAGVIQMTRYFAVHLAGDGIRVNCVSPGGILNEANPQGPGFQKLYNHKVPLGRMAKNADMVGAYAYFLSEDDATYTTGQNLTVDGGYSAW